MGLIGTLTTFSADTLIQSAQVNSNFSEIKDKVNTYCLFTDVARTVTALVTFSHASGIATNTITERTAASGVTIDGLLIKDSGIPEAAVTAHEAALTILESQITDSTVLARCAGTETISGLYTFSHASGISTDDIIERTSDHGVEVDGVVLKDGGVTLAAAQKIDASNTGDAEPVLKCETSGTIPVGGNLGWIMVDLGGTTGYVEVKAET